MPRLDHIIRIRSRLVPVISLLTALALMTPGDSAAGPGSAAFFGVNAQGLFPYYAQTQWPGHLNAISANGIRLVRFDAAWNTIEPAPPSGGVHRFDWRFYDAVVGSMAEAGLRWYPILDYSASWAATQPGNVKSPPASAEAYAAFAAALASRYGRNGSFWQAHPELPVLPVTTYEIWNEENSNYFWQPQPDAARYAELYLAAHTALKTVDPDAHAVVGGLVPARSASDFLRGMLAARPDARDKIDAVAIHPYAQTPQQVANVVLGMRSSLADLGLGSVPLEITEVGWTTRGPGAVSEETRAANFKWLMDWVANCGCGVSRFIAHTWVTPERRQDNREDWFGLYRPNGDPTTSGLAFGEGVRRLSVPTPAPQPPGPVAPVPPAGHVGEQGAVAPAPAAPPAAVATNGAPRPGCLVPKVKGLNLRTARRRVRAAGCQSSARAVRTRRFADGRVVRASARAGTRLKRGALVRLSVARRTRA